MLVDVSPDRLLKAILANAVATTIATSAEEQGLATREIARNTQLASRRTRGAGASVTAATAEAGATTGTAEAVKMAARPPPPLAPRRCGCEQVDTFMARTRTA